MTTLQRFNNVFILIITRYRRHPKTYTQYADLVSFFGRCGKQNKMNTNDLIVIKSNISITLTPIFEHIIHIYSDKQPKQDDFKARHLFMLKLLDTEFKNISEFRIICFEYIEGLGGEIKKLEEFPLGYSPINKVLSRAQDCELSLYFAIKHCQRANISNDYEYDLLRANFLCGYAQGIDLEYKSLWRISYFTEKNLNDLGGDARSKKSQASKELAFKIFKERGYTSYAKCAREIYSELGVTDPNTVSRWLSVMDNKKTK